MIDNKKKEEIKAVWEEAEYPQKGRVMEGCCKRVILDLKTYFSYTENCIKINVMNDGAIYFFDEDENFIYFYPDQLKYLAKALSLARKQV